MVVGVGVFVVVVGRICDRELYSKHFMQPFNMLRIAGTLCMEIV